MMVGDLVRLKYNPGLHKGPLTGRIVGFRDDDQMKVSLLDRNGELTAWGRDEGTIFGHETIDDWVVVQEGPLEAAKIADYYDIITA